MSRRQRWGFRQGGRVGKRAVLALLVGGLLAAGAEPSPLSP